MAESPTNTPSASIVVPNRVSVRCATADDCTLIVQLVTELAVYENAVNQAGQHSLSWVIGQLHCSIHMFSILPVQVQMTPEQLRRDGFGVQPRFQCFIGELDGVGVAYALYFFVYSEDACLALHATMVNELTYRS